MEKMERWFLMFWFLVAGATVAGCTGDESVPAQAPATAETEEVITVEIAKGTMLPQALSVITENGWNPEAVVSIAWPDHQGETGVLAGTKEKQEDELVSAERARLMFLLGEFDPAVPMEAAVYVQLAEDLLAVAGGRMVSVRRIRLRAFDAPPDLAERPFVTGVSVETVPRADFSASASAETPDAEAEPIETAMYNLTDFLDDAAYVPAGGTSTVWAQGSLQKFWMDDASANSFNNMRDGIEMDTRIVHYWDASCGNGWNSNMPNAYRDTEAFDFFATTCGVGTTAAAQLQPWTLYWTWRTFSAFAPQSNPLIHISFQPSTWCGWIPNAAQCEAARAWCMCTRNDMPIEHLIEYRYNEAVGAEMRWRKN